MKIAFLMDPLESMKVHKDTSYALMKAAHQLGWEVHHVLQGDLSLRSHEPFASSRKLTEFPEQRLPHFENHDSSSLNDFDAVWVRKDPPFDRRYFYSTLILDFLEPSVFVINKSAALRDFNEKLAALVFSEFTPNTLISCNPFEITRFLSQFERAVIKPLDGFGGKEIEFVKAGDADLTDKISAATHHGSRWTVVNEFVADAHRGDKRILLVEGEPIGSILRKSETSELHNLDQGGHALPSELTERDREVCKKLKPWLVENKLFFVGIDMLADSLTEINVTSPTGIQELSKFAKIDHPKNVMEAVEKICGSETHPFK